MELGNSSAQAYLLLATGTNEANAHLLQKLTSPGEDDDLVKLEPFLKPVAASLPASIALANLGAVGSAVPLRQMARSQDIADIIFLLSVLEEITDPQTLRSLARHFDHGEEISLGIPSHAQPRRRVSDLALDSFAARLDLKLDFPLLGARRYSDEELTAVRVAVAAALDDL